MDANAEEKPSDLPERPSELTRPKFWRVHLSTAFILMLAAGMLLGIDVLLLPYTRTRTFLGIRSSDPIFIFVIVALHVDVLALVALICEIRIRT